MDTLLGRYRNLIVLAAILFAQIIALAMQVRRPGAEGETRLIRVWATTAVTPFEKAVVHTQKWAHDKWNGYIYLRHVDSENQQLRAEIDRMKLEQARLSEDANMARRIQTLLAFKEQYVENTVAAQVIGTSGSEQSRVLYIDKGSSDGIKPDMAVITPTGVVGKVVQVFSGSSQVLPINDQLSGVGAALKSLRLQGILKGAPNGTTTLQYIMSDEPVQPGQEVVTSGGDRIFPKGLPIGTVASVEPGKDLFLNIRVVPSARLDRLEEVLVVTKVQEKLPDAKDLGPIRASDILSERLPGVPTAPNVDAAGNLVSPAGGAANPASSNAPPGGVPAKPGTAGSMNPPNGAAAGSTAKPSGAAVSGGSKPAAVPVNEPAQRTADGVTPPKVVHKPPVTPPSDTNPKKPATAPSTGENPPQ
jgi:rod shape-determining protein MreC